MNDHPQWTQQAKGLLDESAQNLDAATLSRLNRARQAALAQQRARGSRTWFLPGALASACALLLAVAVWHAPRPADEIAQANTVTNIGAGESDADDEAFYEDLDFYAWLDAQEQDNDG